MALIPCPQCKKRISSKASQCNHCKADLTGNTDSLSTIGRIEQTNKLMNHTFIFMTLFIAGIVYFFWGGQPAQGLSASVSITIAVIGFVGYLITRVRIVLHKRKSV